MADALQERLFDLEPGRPQEAYELMKDFMRAGRYTEDIADQINKSAISGGVEAEAEWRRLVAETVVWPNPQL